MQLHFPKLEHFAFDKRNGNLFQNCTELRLTETFVPQRSRSDPETSGDT
jgi:hypothetical protein